MRRKLNGPFSLQGVSGLRYFGVRGRLVHAPLWVKVVGIDGKAPADDAGRPVPLQVEWKQQDGPTSCEILNSGVSGTDECGRATAVVRSGDRPGVYRIRATLPEYPSCADALFSVYTEGVVARLAVLPLDPIVAGKPCQLLVQAWDWRGHAVKHADLFAFPKCVDTYEAPIRGKRAGGTYRFTIPSRQSGKLQYSIVDPSTGTECEASVILVPGRPKTLTILPVENPRSQAPYSQTRIDLKVADLYGNVIPNSRVSWKSSAGTLTPVAPGDESSSSVLLTFGEDRSIVVTARLGRQSVSDTFRIPGVYLRFLESARYTPVGGRFLVQMEVFPPAREGVIRELRISLRQPHSVRLDSVRMAGLESIIPPPKVQQTPDLLRLTWNDLNIPWSECSECLAAVDLCYECTDVEKACFYVAEASITTHHSPDKKTELNPGVGDCWLQKLLSSKDLCLNICIVAKNDIYYEIALAKAKEQVSRAKELFKKNIDVCCPRINIQPCYSRFSYADYKRNNPNGVGDNGDGLPISQGPNPVPNTTDKSKDHLPLTNAVKWLLTQARVQQCLTVFVVPAVENAGAHLGGYTVSKNRFPESVQAPAGPTIFLYDAAGDPGTLAHELGHALMDSPPDRSDHVNDAKRIMNNTPGGKTGEEFIDTECSRIFDHIGQYGGTCK